MSRPRRIHPAALVLSLGLMLAACGDGAEPPSGAESTAGTPATPPGTPSGTTRDAPRPRTPADPTGDAATDKGAEGDFALGAPRDDLDRFYGVYGDSAHPGRDFFVAPAKAPVWMENRRIPPGYLMVGAMWGDVAPWYMRSVSDTRFEQQWVGDFGRQKVVEFSLGDDGRAVAMSFETAFEDRGRLRRQGDLPANWR